MYNKNVNKCNTLRNQIHLMLKRRNFWIGLTITFTYMIVSYIYTVNACRNYEVSSIKAASTYFVGNNTSIFYDYFKLIFPFVVVFPFAFSGFEDKYVGIDKFIITKSNKRNYYKANVITCFLGSYLIIFIPFTINIFLNAITFVENENTFLGIICSERFWLNVYGQTGYSTILFLNLFLKNPIIYNLFFTIILSTFSGILGVFSYACSFRIKNYKMLIFLPSYCLFFISSNIKIFGINYDLFDYVTITQSSNRNNIIFILICLSMILYSYITIKKQLTKDIL